MLWAFVASTVHDLSLLEYAALTTCRKLPSRIEQLAVCEEILHVIAPEPTPSFSNSSRSRSRSPKTRPVVLSTVMVSEARLIVASSDAEVEASW